MSPEELISQIKSVPETVQFRDVMDVISAHYTFTPTGFWNGNLYNQPGENEGSCRIFAFARLNGLDEQETLHCFGDYYRQDVCANPDGDKHANIRNFMKTGWAGVQFDTPPLTNKS